MLCCLEEMKSRNSASVVIFGILLIATACNPFVESKYSNCVVAKDASSFIGEKLKNDGNVESSRLLTTDCMDKDREIDGSDGKNRGKVRWAVCLQGPDCDEAGMY
jgi:hypothetical protein